MEEATSINMENIKENFGPRIPVSKPHTTDYSQNIVIRKFPLLGRIHFVNDRYGIMTLGFTTFYWVFGVFVALFIILLPRYEDGRISLFLIIVEVIIAICCIISLFRAATTNPGRVPLLEDISTFDTADWVFCQKCQRKRPKRAHHCRRCQQCVLRMDHHCPWINNCVGEENHWLFMQLIIYAFLLSAYAFVLCMLHFWYWPPCETCNKERFYIKHGIWFTYLLTIMGVAMSLFMIGNMMGQHFNLIMDRTTLENLMSPLTVEDALKGKHNTRLPGKHLSELDAKSGFRRSGFMKWWVSVKTEYQAYRDLCGPGSCPYWMIPCRKKQRENYGHFQV